MLALVPLPLIHSPFVSKPLPLSLPPPLPPPAACVEHVLRLDHRHSHVPLPPLVVALAPQRPKLLKRHLRRKTLIMLHARAHVSLTRAFACIGRAHGVGLSTHPRLIPIRSAAQYLAAVVGVGEPDELGDFLGRIKQLLEENLMHVLAEV